MKRSLLCAILVFAACSSDTENLQGDGNNPDIDPGIRACITADRSDPDPDPPVLTPGVLEVELSTEPPRNAWVVIGDADGELQEYARISAGDVLSFERDGLSTVALVLLEDDGSCTYALGADAARPGEKIRFYGNDGAPPFWPVNARLRAMLPAPPPGTEKVWVSTCGVGNILDPSERTAVSDLCAVSGGFAGALAVARGAGGVLLGQTRLDRIAIAGGEEREVQLPPYESTKAEYILELGNFPSETTQTDLQASSIDPENYISDFLKLSTRGQPRQLKATIPSRDFAPNLILSLTVLRGTLTYNFSAPSYDDLPPTCDLGGDFPVVASLSASGGDRVTLSWELDGSGSAHGFTALFDRFSMTSRRFASSYTFPELPEELRACSPTLHSGAYAGVELFDAGSQDDFRSLQFTGIPIDAIHPRFSFLSTSLP